MEVTRSPAWRGRLAVAFLVTALAAMFTLAVVIDWRMAAVWVAIVVAVITRLRPEDRP